MGRIARGLIVSIVVAASYAGPALAQNHPPDAPTIGVSDSVVVPCTAITMTGTNWQAGSIVDITFDSTVLTNAVVDAHGNVSVRVTIPCSATLSAHVLGSSGIHAPGNRDTVTTEISVVGAGAVGVTEGDVSRALLLMAVLFVAGIVAIVASRRRARKAATPA